MNMDGLSGGEMACQRNQLTECLLTGSIVVRLALLVLAAGLLLACLAAPVSAGATASGTGQDTAADDQSAIRVAYINWLAAKQESGMEATIRYITALNGDTAGLARIRDKFHATSARIQKSGSGSVSESILSDFRDLTRQFREETLARMDSVHGNEEDLTSAVHYAVEADETVKKAETGYWRIRMTTEPASFDRYIHESQATLTTLQEHGYDISLAQETLGRIAAIRGDFVMALQAQDYSAAEVIRGRIDDTAAVFETMVRDIQDAGRVQDGVASGRTELS